MRPVLQRMSAMHGDTIGTLCARHPLALPVLHELGLEVDPAATIEQCCRTSGISAKAATDAIAFAEATIAKSCQDRTLVELIDDVVRTYHRPFTNEVATVRDTLEAAHHATGHTAWSVLLAELAELEGDLAQHIEMEERVLFPWLRSGRGAGISASIRAMQLEHGDAIAQLLEIEAQARRCVAADPTNRSAAAAIAGLRELERWLCEHIHVESNALFPRALQGR